MLAKTKTNLSATDLAVLRELVSMATTEEGRSLAPTMGSLASAFQYKRLYELLRKYIARVPRAAKVLDWGAGNGHFCYYLARTGRETWGFSFDHIPLWSCIGNPERLVVGDPKDPTTLPFEDEAFDAVVSVGVLEHVRETGGDEVASLKEIRQVLKPEGLFICYHLPNKYSLTEKLVSLVPGKYYHGARYTRGDITRMAEEAGFGLLEVRRYGLLPRNELARLPRPLRYSEPFAALYEALDRALGLLFSPFCQSYLFVAVRR